MDDYLARERNLKSTDGYGMDHREPSGSLLEKN